VSTLGRGRVVRAVDARDAVPVDDARASDVTAAPPGWGRRVAREIADAHAEAAVILARAERQAQALAERALREAKDDAARALDAATAEQEARFAAQFLALRVEDERRADRDQDRVIAAAIALAERIVGHGVSMEPELIVDLARRAILQARGARRIVVEASAEDAATLRSHLDALGFPSDALDVRESSTLGRGDLCLHTDLGTLHARITPQLERLAEALRDVLAQRR